MKVQLYYVMLFNLICILTKVENARLQIQGGNPG